ncbi:unnamed protein product [Mytilus edulis]|uniref:Ig-like domain-containing protein n=1 Tax=Mytilus edulis TaxID=6550 RepID=A0A8S3UFM3_MYTED|nr:unnamed protein product [Mytilus edulis]
MCDAIENVNVNRCKTNIPYKTQLKCNITLYSCLKGMKDHDQLMRMEDYYCEEHEQSHNAKQIYSDWYEDDPKGPLDDLNHMRINFTKMGIIAADILADALFDLIRVGDPTFKAPPRNECDITKLYNIHRNKLNAFKPTHGWGGDWGNLNANDIEPGDDIERIRLTRNELNHSSKYEMQDKHFFNSAIYIERPWIDFKAKIAFIIMSRGSGCTISCDIITPLPVEAIISWFKDCNGKEKALKVDKLSKKYHGSTIEYPSLVIRNVDEADEGSYSCRILYPSEYKVKEDSETVVWPRTYLHVKDKQNVSNNKSVDQIIFLLDQ